MGWIGNNRIRLWETRMAEWLVAEMVCRRVGREEGWSRECVVTKSARESESNILLSHGRVGGAWGSDRKGVEQEGGDG